MSTKAQAVAVESPEADFCRCGIEVEPGRIVYFDSIPGYPPNTLILSPETAGHMTFLVGSVRVYPKDAVSRRSLAVAAGYLPVY
jgi:hypothetical protein